MLICKYTSNTRKRVLKMCPLIRRALPKSTGLTWHWCVCVIIDVLYLLVFSYGEKHSDLTINNVDFTVSVLDAPLRGPKPAFWKEVTILLALDTLHIASVW